MRIGYVALCTLAGVLLAVGCGKPPGQAGPAGPSQMSADGPTAETPQGPQPASPKTPAAGATQGPSSPAPAAGNTPAANPKTEQSFSAMLSGEQEVPPVQTNASGKATFQWTGNGELRYEVTVSDLQGATMAHLHMAPQGENGDVVAWLYPASGPPPKPIEETLNGQLVSGVVTADKLVGPLKGKTVGDLVGKIRAGDVYVNVHTEKHPEGELRGQVH